jgi:hypothetical protein
MNIERIKFLGVTYLFYPDKPEFYYFDKKAMCHIIIYTVKDYAGVKYTAEWKIPGTQDKDILYARRMALKLPPWYVDRVYGTVNDLFKNNVRRITQEDYIK